MTRPHASSWRCLLPGAVLALAALASCTGNAAPHRATGAVVPACSAALCNITQNAWNHIDQRHCQGSCQADDKSIFVAGYCGSRANAVTFCQTLMGTVGCAGVLQPNGRIAYTAQLAATVGEDRNNGCNNTQWGTVIYDPNAGEVVTQFPGL